MPQLLAFMRYANFFRASFLNPILKPIGLRVVDDLAEASGVEVMQAAATLQKFLAEAMSDGVISEKEKRELERLLNKLPTSVKSGKAYS